LKDLNLEERGRQNALLRLIEVFGKPRLKTH
jgi:hypothetical protein